MASNVLVERALALVPDFEEFLPLTDAVIGSSHTDREKLWARSHSYTTLGKRVVDPVQLSELVPTIVQRAQQRLQELFTLIVRAIQQQQAGDLVAAAHTLIEAGELEEGNRQLAKAEKVYTLALEIARDLRQKDPHVLALRRLGRVNRTLVRLDTAWTWYEQSFELSRDQLDVPGQVIACQGLGNVCSDRGQRDEARSWYERGLRLASDLEQPALVWPFYANLSSMVRQEGRLDEAERLLSHAREYIEAAGTGGSIFYWYNNQGLLLSARDDETGAERVYREGLAHADDPFWELTLRVNLGHSLVAQRRHFEAEEEARKAEEIAIVNRFIPDLVDIYELLGKIARARCDEEGFVFFEQALEVCRERELPQVNEAGVYHGYGMFHAACGREEEGRAYLERAQDLYAELGLIPELKKVTTDLEALSPDLPEAPTAAG